MVVYRGFVIGLDPRHAFPEEIHLPDLVMPQGGQHQRSIEPIEAERTQRSAKRSLIQIIPTSMSCQ